jgi:hypothetical protein
MNGQDAARRNTLTVSKTTNSESRSECKERCGWATNLRRESLSIGNMSERKQTNNSCGVVYGKRRGRNETESVHLHCVFAVLSALASRLWVDDDTGIATVLLSRIAILLHCTALCLFGYICLRCVYCGEQGRRPSFEVDDSANAKESLLKFNNGWMGSGHKEDQLPFDPKSWRGQNAECRMNMNMRTGIRTTTSIFLNCLL